MLTAFPRALQLGGGLSERGEPFATSLVAAVPAPVPARQTALGWERARGVAPCISAPQGAPGTCGCLPSPPRTGLVSLSAAFPAVLDKGLPVSVPAEQTQALAESPMGCYGSWRRREADRGALLAPWGYF